MKKILFASFIMLFCFFRFSIAQTQENTATSKGLEWHTSMEEAYKLSNATNKPIFALFTGSDWCIWCKRLDNNVFSKPEFIEWANKNVILLELDFPKHKQLAPELTQQNNSMQQALKITGYPTVWILFAIKNDSTGSFNLNTIGSLGYPSDGEVGNEQIKFLENANKILARIKAK